MVANLWDNKSEKPTLDRSIKQQASKTSRYYQIFENGLKFSISSVMPSNKLNPTISNFDQ